ncbi:MAG: 50S ribosomal protein L23 [Candidatus Binataceae bacterium]|jgi:large subunit ribosomal protein L23
MNLEQIVMAPLITEKGTFVGEKSNQVVFRVRLDASKDLIRDAVEQLFKVTVLKVRTIKLMGKNRRRGAIKGRRSDWKKAYVTLKDGDRIEFFEGV